MHLSSRLREERTGEQVQPCSCLGGIGEALWARQEGIQSSLIAKLQLASWNSHGIIDIHRD